MRALRLLAGAEAASLAVLLGNLLTVHADAVSTLVGPLHGAAYLAVVAATFQATAAAPGARATPGGPGARARSLVPGVGGLLALRALRGAHAPARTR